MIRSHQHRFIKSKLCATNLVVFCDEVITFVWEELCMLFHGLQQDFDTIVHDIEVEMLQSAWLNNQMGQICLDNGAWKSVNRSYFIWGLAICNNSVSRWRDHKAALQMDFEVELGSKMNMSPWCVLVVKMPNKLLECISSGIA